MTPAPLLVVGIGNPSRGDDALGPAFVERAAEQLAAEVAAGEVELMTDFQLQIEHALDLVGRARVVFVDASVGAAPPFEYARVEAEGEPGALSHAMSPAAVLATHRRVVGEAAPEAWVLAIRGERFELGEALSEAARAHLDAAVAWFARRTSGARQSGAEEARRIEVEGTVQGVGLRPWVARRARALGLRGTVRNTSAGATIEAAGTTEALDALTRALQSELPAAARVRAMRVTAIDATGLHAGFSIATSDAVGASRLGLPPDLAACDACLAEVDDARDRHHGYAFTSCTECGPRLSIAERLPYDRARTTMAAFAPCAACASEYDDEADRRYHAQTIACPACGPRVWLADAAGNELRADGHADAIAEAAARLRGGEILAVQGMGGFHLVCDATRPDVVAELRRRKRREHRPFAVLVRDVAMAERLAELDAPARATLVSPARPIVLAPARHEVTEQRGGERGSELAPSVLGPSRRVGVMLPSTPLHHRLAALSDRPLVMTSGNVSGAPVEIDHAGAVRSLGPIVDAFLLHDRPIARRVEDSVVALGHEGPRVVRRARGLAPEPIRLPARAPAPILAVGGHLKNTACIVVEDCAYLTPHLGDIDTVEGEAAWLAEVASLERLLGVVPDVVAHDLHPGYATTRLSAARAPRRLVGVQHHHAHVLAAVAELGLDEPVVGVAYDGTGWGPDGTAWGGEILLVEGARWWRLATVRPLPLPGGERAIRAVWRQALAALHDALGPEEARAVAARLPALAAVPPDAQAIVARMLATGVEVVPARGIGRWFDAIGALALGILEAGFEGHVAVALEEACSASALETAHPYPLERPSGVTPVAPDEVPVALDLRPTVRAAVDELLSGGAAATVAARFHRALIDATAEVVEEALVATGARWVVPTGGAFQNAHLARGLGRRLGDRVRAPRAVPTSDGGLALGQAWAAVLALRGEEA